MEKHLQEREDKKIMEKLNSSTIKKQIRKSFKKIDESNDESNKYSFSIIYKMFMSVVNNTNISFSSKSILLENVKEDDIIENIIYMFKNILQINNFVNINNLPLLVKIIENVSGYTKNQIYKLEKIDNTSDIIKIWIRNDFGELDWRYMSNIKGITIKEAVYIMETNPTVQNFNSMSSENLKISEELNKLNKLNSTNLKIGSKVNVFGSVGFKIKKIKFTDSEDERISNILFKVVNKELNQKLWVNFTDMEKNDTIIKKDIPTTHQYESYLYDDKSDIRVNITNADLGNLVKFKNDFRIYIISKMISIDQNFFVNLKTFDGKELKNINTNSNILFHISENLENYKDLQDKANLLTQEMYTNEEIEVNSINVFQGDIVKFKDYDSLYVVMKLHIEKGAIKSVDIESFDETKKYNILLELLYHVDYKKDVSEQAQIESDKMISQYNKLERIKTFMINFINHKVYMLIKSVLEDHMIDSLDEYDYKNFNEHLYDGSHKDEEYYIMMESEIIYKYIISEDIIIHQKAFNFINHFRKYNV